MRNHSQSWNYAESALLDGVVVTPTFVKQSAGAVERIIGALSATEIVLRTVGLHEREGSE